MAQRPLRNVLTHLHRLIGPPHAGALTDKQLLEDFASRRDEDAFAALVRRHGNLVMGVTWRVLRHAQDAEDVYQATFLLLARKAAALGWHESVAGWLHESAYRLALKARTAAAHRREREREAGTRPKPESLPELAWRELCSVLDDELRHLPVRYRAPLLLCYLEGATRDEAARSLGWSLRTLRRRLERGRELLRARLTRRGLTLAAGLTALGLAPPAPAAAVAPGLIVRTTAAALQFGAGRAAGTGLVSEAALGMVEGGMSSFLVPKLKFMAALVLTLGVLGTGAGIATRWPSEAERAKEAAALRKSLADDLVDFPPGPPRMVARNQQPMLGGGRVVLYARARHGNYPLATYALHLGLRGDDRSVANDVNLIFGNARRAPGFVGAGIDSVPGVPGHGAAGMEGFSPTNEDEFRVDCLGGNRHRILDFGEVDYDYLTASETAEWPGEADTVPVRVHHVYLIRLLDPEHPRLTKPLHFKLKVLRHRDNDAVLFDWRPLRPPAKPKPEGRT